MGSAISRVMEKSNAYKKYLFPSSSKMERVSEKEQLLPTKPKTSLQQQADKQEACCSYHSREDSFSTRREKSSSQHSSHHSRSLSLSSGSSSAMDCFTSKSTDDELVSSAHHKVRSKNVEESLPSTSKPTGTRMRKTSRPIRGRQELSTADLHKCQSEPFKKTLNTHRTSSDQPLATQTDVRPKTYLRLSADYDRSTKHMEGGQSTSQTKTHHKSKPTAVPIEMGDHLPVGQRKAQPSSDRSSRTEQESSKSISTSSASEVDETTATTATSYSASDASKASQEPSLARLLRNMEYVSNVMKKKTYEPIFEANKYSFINKIFTSSQLQYGYQDDRYIKIGCGEFGEVLYGRMNEGGQLVAIKALKRDKSDMFALLQEAFMLQLASNTGFAAHYQGLAPFCALGDRYLDWAIICDYVGSPNGPSPYDFRQTLKKARTAHRTLQLVLDWVFTCTKIAFAVKQFHNMGMLLNDIKADNILLRPTTSGSHDPVFVDFGLASIGEGITLALEVNDSNRAKILKEYSHIAPEVLFGGETNAASDVFSLGKALSLVADAFPVEALLNIISRCTLWNVSERPSVDDMINSFHCLSRNVMLNQ